MWNLSSILLIFMIIHSTVSDEKCTIWQKNAYSMMECCKIPKPINDKDFESVVSKMKNTTKNFCTFYQGLSDHFNVSNFDKTAYKNFLQKTIKESDWQPIFAKNVDFCFELAPKLLPSFAKTLKLSEEGCGLKFILSANCWLASAFVDCPQKYFTDSDECKKLKTNINECQQNPDELKKSFVPIFQTVLGADSINKCTPWLKNPESAKKCCKIPMPENEDADKILAKQMNGTKPTYCELSEKVAEILNLKSFDKITYKKFLEKAINNSDWQPIFVKNSDFCIDFVPKIYSPFVKKLNVSEEGCGGKLLVSVVCWMSKAFVDCPQKYFTDTNECKELKTAVKVCLDNPEEIVKALN